MTSWRGDAAAAAAFLILFPSFITYHVLVQGGTLPPVLGGYGTASAVLALPFAGYAFTRQLQSRGFAPTWLEALFVAHLVLFGSVVFLGRQAGVNPTITGPHLAYLFKFVVWYLVARSLNGEWRWTRRVALVSFAGIIALVLGVALARRSIAVVLLPLDPGAAAGDYQASAMIFVAMASFAIPPLPRWLRWPVYVLAVATLFLVGARSEFAAFFVLAVVIEFCKARSRLLLTLLVVAGALGSVLFLSTLDVSSSTNRVLGLLQVAADHSAILRREMMIEGIRTIIEHPVLGAYASYIPGEYSHNILSAWVDLGLVGFFLVSLLVCIPLGGLAMRFASDSRRDDFIRALAIGCVVALLMLAAKHHTYQLIPVSLGLYVRYRIERRTRLLAAVSAPAGP